MSKSLMILGAGYTARVVRPLAARRYTHVLATSREPDHHLAHFPLDCRVPFDLRDRNTWKNIPSDCDLLWCFPAEPRDLVEVFAAETRLASHRLVVLGSTSAYLADTSREYPPPWMDETQPINHNISRVQGEEFLRTRCGGSILRVAGIYGPRRNPLDWIRSGRVGPSRKYVNLIHVEDLAEVCLMALERGMPGETYNVSDGTPRPWKDICRTAHDRWGIASERRADDDSTGKRIAISKLLSLFETSGKALVHGDLYRALEQLHSERSLT